ncbi:MAG: hypothetical protein HY454_01820 [Parcubacteria group bacterium]|nr:hypothetical protein [Parcubacteria group bacterium]
MQDLKPLLRDCEGLIKEVLWRHATEDASADVKADIKKVAGAVNLLIKVVDEHQRGIEELVATVNSLVMRP